jgi:hypothetical protein
MLEIKANKSIYFDGEKLDIGNRPMRDFLLSVLSCPVVLDKDLLLGDFVHILYDIRDFINLYCCEEYEVLRALVNAGRMSSGYDYIIIYKSVETTSDNVLKINVKSEFKSYENQGKTYDVCNLKIVFDDKMDDRDEIFVKHADIKSDFSLIEIIDVLFQDVLYSLKKDNILV